MSQSELDGFRSWLSWFSISKIRDGLSYESSIKVPQERVQLTSKNMQQLQIGVPLEAFGELRNTKTSF